VGRPPEMYVRLPGNLCSSAGEKNMRACGEKGGGCGKVCSAAGALFSRRKKVAAVGKFVRLREKGRGCGKVCSAAGKRSRLWKGLFSRGSIVQPPENLFSRRSDRSPGTSLQLYLQKQPKRSNAKRKKKKIK